MTPGVITGVGTGIEAGAVLAVIISSDADKTVFMLLVIPAKTLPHNRPH